MNHARCCYRLRMLACGFQSSEVNEAATEAADAIDELLDIFPKNCAFCIGCEVEEPDGSGCKTAFVLSPKRAKAKIQELIGKEEKNEANL